MPCVTADASLVVVYHVSVDGVAVGRDIGVDIALRNSIEVDKVLLQVLFVIEHFVQMISVAGETVVLVFHPREEPF